MKTFSIKEVSDIFNISTNKIRFYEKKELITPRRDFENDYRYFTEDDLIKLQTILMYRELDLSIENIKDIFTDESKDNILNHFHTQWKAINNQIHRIQLIKGSLEEIIDNIYESEDKTYNEKIIKIIEATNELWKIKNQWHDKWDFNNWARTYDKSVERDYGSGILNFYKNYNEIIDTTYKKAVRDKESTIKILEIGVGTGNLSRRFLEHQYDIIGIDQSREMLNVAKEKFLKLKLRLGDFLNIPFENGKFDVVVSTYAFHHLREEEKGIAIREMIRVLKDNGRIVIGDLMFENQEEKEKIISRLTEEEIEEIEDEYYSNIESLRGEFKKYNKELEVTRMDELVFIVEVN